MVMRTIRRSLVALLALGPLGCATILGTGDYEPCGDDEVACEDTSSSSGSGGDCIPITVRVRGFVKAEIDDDDTLDVEDGATEEFCLAPGQHTIVAYCDLGDGDATTPVDWSNPACTDGASSCTFVLTERTSFDLDPIDCE
jgi:hypothetical protein